MGGAHMSRATFDGLVARIQGAAAQADAGDALRAVLQDSMDTQEAIADAIAAMPEDEVLVFEDESCSIWTCRYGSEMVFAPHEHCMPVHVAVYRGTEIEVLYEPEAGVLRHGGNTAVTAGQVVRLGKDAVHAITAEGAGQSHAIHVYEGPRTKVKRRLFDWDTGAEVEFTMENFHGLARRKADMAEFSAL